MDRYHVASFSGGKDSTAMVLLLLEKKYPLDEVLFCDTTVEFPAMYRHIDRIRPIIEGHGVKFTTLRGKKSFEEYMLRHVYTSRKGVTKQGYTWPDMGARWCTRALKIRPIDNYLKTLPKNTLQYIGLASDESARLQRKNNQNQNHRHPLVVWGMTEADCLDYCYMRGYDWEGLYDHFARASCFLCPFQRLDALRALRRHYPDLWSYMLDIDSKSERQFRAEYSIKDLDTRFYVEELREKEGLSVSPRCKNFQKAVELAKAGAKPEIFNRHLFDGSFDAN